MKKLIFLIAVGLGIYYTSHSKHNPVEIKQPSYAEMRVQLEVPGRQIDIVLFGKMADEEDCRQRTESVWKKLIDGCQTCTFTVVDCKPELASRYARLFDDTPISVTYLNLTHGSRLERDGRIVFWGVTAAESDRMCELASAAFQKRYEGKIGRAHV